LNGNGLSIGARAAAEIGLIAMTVVCHLPKARIVLVLWVPLTRLGWVIVAVWLS